MSRSLEKALFFTLAVAVSAVILNILSTSYPWCIYPIFGILWWPLSVYFAGKKQPLLFAIGGTAMLWALFLLTYLFSSPGAHPWFLYPMLGTGWWPLSVWGSLVGARRFSVTASLYIILTVLVINLLSSPGYWWWIYPSVFVVWWPVSQYLRERNKKEGEEE
ncbi:MAG: hypothetical protein ABIK64_02015 [Bacillota bacterium]